jgi:type IV pilus assembly protein PilB
MFGESVVIRVLDRTVVSLDLNKVGMDGHILSQFRQLIHKPNGIVLVTGPTGAGKTTTLYSALNELNEITDKIITTEDPVEYDIDGIVQCPINHDIGLTFASALRSILRQDPDTILVGEIRDLETAQIAVQASLTGHMVFSTLHTNDAPSSITRLRRGHPGAAAGAQDLRGLPHRIRAEPRDADGAEPSAQRRGWQEVLLRPGLRPLQ